MCLGTHLNGKTNLSMNIITKEYLSSVKMNLQGRNNLSMRSTFKDLILVNFILWAYAISCFVIIPMITKNTFYSNKEDFFIPKGIISLMNNFYSAGLIQRFC